MRRTVTFDRGGVPAALAAALLFGAATPLAKGLLRHTDPWLLAGLLYLGAGLGLTSWRWLRRTPGSAIPPTDWPWLIGAIVSGGIVGPVLLMFGLSSMRASNASLLLNAEGVFTALLAWFAFHESFDRRLLLGMGAIIAGAIVLSWPSGVRLTSLGPTLAVMGACLAWAIDNNLTRKIALGDAAQLASVKGLAAGTVNLGIAFMLGARLPALPDIAGAMVIGWLAYGISLVLFLIALRHLGTARTSAYFSVAPFFGALLAIPLLGEPVSFRLAGAAFLMAIGVWLHLTEKHVHAHTHEGLAHPHSHVHDEHHRHTHDTPVPPGTRHRHWHRHEPLVHAHTHYPDSHHRHRHG